jgi:hypothetical protein
MYFVSKPEDAACDFPGGQQFELRRPPPVFFDIEERRSSHRAVCNGSYQKAKFIDKTRTKHRAINFFHRLRAGVS